MTSSSNETIDGRDTLNEYLEKPLELDSGSLSTQVNLSATSLSSGGLSGEFLIKNQGRIVIPFNDGKVAIYLGF